MRRFLKKKLVVVEEKNALRMMTIFSLQKAHEIEKNHKNMHRS
jgi:hypothetical protein